MKTLGVFVGVLYESWITFDLFIPSVFGYAALALFRFVMDTTTALSSGFGNNNLVVVLSSNGIYRCY